jgi:hypothetical protein
MSKRDNACRATVQIIKDYSKKLEKKEGIELTSYGLNYTGPEREYEGKINEIEVGYKIEKNMKYKEARSLFYSIVDGLLDEINSSCQNKTHLYHNPLGYQDLWVSLSFDRSGTGRLKKDDVSMIYIYENRISYLIVDKEDERPADRYRRADLEIEHMLSSTRCIKRELPEGPEAELE